jgi:glutamate synthase (NADPH/NADH) large chain
VLEDLRPVQPRESRTDVSLLDRQQWVRFSHSL